jgi:hypothetical protein
MGEAPVAQAVAAALEIDFAIAQHHERNHRPALIEAAPREHRGRRSQHSERTRRVGPRRVVDVHPAQLDDRLERSRKTQPHRVDPDRAVRARRKMVRDERREPPGLEHEHEQDDRGKPRKADAKYVRLGSRPLGRQRRVHRLLRAGQPGC